MTTNLQDGISLKSFFSDRKGGDRTKTLETLINYVKECNNKPVKFLMLWGAGDKSKASQADKDTLLYLIHFLDNVQNIFDKKVKFKIIFTDTHIYLNGYNPNTATGYFSDIIYHLKKQRFSYDFSSNICKEKIRKRGYIDYKKFIDDIVKNATQWFDEINIEEQQITNFYKYALKHSDRIGKHSSGIFFNNEIESAKGYLYFANFEKEIISEKFKDYMFITYMSREEEFALPSLPIVRLYSIKSGLRTRPWFTQ